MSWIRALTPQAGTAVNVEAERQVLGIVNMIEEAANRVAAERGQPIPHPKLTTLGEHIARRRHGRTPEEERELQKLISEARRKAADQEAALRVNSHNPPEDWKPGDTPDLPGGAKPPEKPADPEPPQAPVRERPKPNRLRRGGTYSYI